MQQIYSAACKVEASYELPDLSTALRQIQSQYDSIAAKNLEVRCHFLVIKKHNPFCFCHKNMPGISSQGCGDSSFFSGHGYVVQIKVSGPEQHLHQTY